MLTCEKRSSYYSKAFKQNYPAESICKTATPQQLCSCGFAIRVTVAEQAKRNRISEQARFARPERTDKRCHAAYALGVQVCMK